jgi:hypothetical protein
MSDDDFRERYLKLRATKEVISQEATDALRELIRATSANDSSGGNISGAGKDYRNLGID